MSPCATRFPPGIDVSTAAIWRADRAAPIFAWMRAHDPVHWTPDSPYGGYWSITRYDDLHAIELRPAAFSSSWALGGITLFGDSGSSEEEQLPIFIAMDQAEHRVQRRTIAPAFDPSEIARLTPALRRGTEALIDSLPIGEPFDWLDRLSIELTTQMLAILLDFPWEDRRKLGLWSDRAGDIEAASDPVLGRQRMRMLQECGSYFLKLRRQRRDGHGTDLISRMQRSPDMRALSPRAYLGNLVLLIIGGNDTTRNTISALPVVNTRFPDEWRQIVADRTRNANAAQELVRWQTLLAHMRRTASADAEIGGKHIRAGDKVVLWYYSANRDETHFANADRFVATRPNTRRQLAFGAGVHRCLGARLGLLHVSILIETLLDRRLMPVQSGPATHVPSSFVHGYRTLPVSLVPTPDRCVP